MEPARGITKNVTALTDNVIPNRACKSDSCDKIFAYKKYHHLIHEIILLFMSNEKGEMHEHIHPCDGTAKNWKIYS